MATIVMRFPEGRAKALTLSYDDGVEQDIKLIEVMNRYGLKGTFNLNSGCYAAERTVYEVGHIHRRLTQEQATNVYKYSGHEVAVHSLTHPHLEQLPIEACTHEVMADRENLERQFDTIICGMAYPFGTYSDDVVASVEKAGIGYARTVSTTECFDLPKDWLRLETTCHHKHPKLMILAERFVEAETDEPWLFYLWGHSYEFEADANWEVIETFARYVGGRENIWYATNKQVYAYVKAYEQVQFSSDKTKCYNPTAIDLYFTYEGELVKVPAGKEQVLK